MLPGATGGYALLEGCCGGLVYQGKKVGARATRLRPQTWCDADRSAAAGSLALCDWGERGRGWFAET